MTVPPVVVRAAWGLALPLLCLSYSCQGPVLAHEPRTGFGLFSRAFGHLLLLAAASSIGLAAIPLARSTFWEQRGWTTTMARLATLFIVGAVGLALFQPPAQPASTLAVGIHDAGWIRSWPSGVTPIPPPPMIDESFVIGTGVAEDRVGALRVRGSVLRLPGALGREPTEIDLDAVRSGTSYSRTGGETFVVLHRLGAQWISVVGWRVSAVGGPRVGEDLSLAAAFPGRVRAAVSTSWAFVCCAPIALALLLSAERGRRRLGPLSAALHGTPLDDERGGPTSSIRLFNGTTVKVTTPLPSIARTVFVHAERSSDAYREEPRGFARVLHVSRLDRDETLAGARTRIARLDALCVLVVLLLTAPALGAHLRGLTVSLPVGYNAAP